ncbi:hypothetical protein PRIPAC_96319 [Pristionchus pacificus]|uniref:CBM21 domain-containing protein n=1 Tax=Pristionchus pacificus TaxID=54126 RepID=A0A2A6CGP9_PRIPA|nr:hypothetical protein PRIPAC_96319 [Pristionchus pacificus]|eukprot:PDM77309.1 hypothetical protein PRIPAC_40259 [Pristionchus pacificus]
MECMGHDEWAHDGLAHSAPAAFLYPGCRRAASFPFVGEKDLAMPSVLKVRSQSESEGLNRRRNVMTLEELKIKMSEYPETREEESGCESESVSSTLSQSGSSTDLADLATDELSALLDEKKRVRFADDCGKELFYIKVMTEPSDVPPLISPAVLRRFRGADWDEDETVQHSSWILSFPQPASEYIRFRHNIDKNKISLENILLKNDSLHMTGTIKAILSLNIFLNHFIQVANIAFEKRVFIRLTTNSWQSYLDRPAVYQQSSNKVHDTFTFDIEIPRDTSADSRIEFCVCYVAGGQEYWDSNDGKNYVLLSSIKSTHTNVLSPHTPLFGSFKDKNDAYNQRYDNWSSFASWKNLSVDGPYW